MLLLAGCTSNRVNNITSNVNNNISQSGVNNDNVQVTANYTFYVTVPVNTPINDSVNITFFSDVDWQLWKPMTYLGNNTWFYSMPAGWLPTGATIISYGYTRRGDWDKTELLNLDNSSFWINRSFPSNRNYGFVKYDIVKSWRDIVTISPDEIIRGVVHAIVPLDADRVVLTDNGLNYELNKVRDLYFSANLSLLYNSSFTLTAYYSNNSVINSNNFLFDREVFAYVAEPGVGRILVKGHSFSGCHNCAPYNNEDYLPFVNSSYDLMKAEGATWVSFNPFWYLTNYTTSDLRPIYRDEYNSGVWSGWMYYTISDYEVRSLIRWAHQRDLKVFLMPHLSVINWSETVPGKGNLSPVDVDAFFNSYTNFQLHYARIAKEESVELYSIGNEMDSVTDESNTLSTGYNKTAKWYGVIDAVRSVYDGNVTYSCSCSHNDDSPCTPEKIQFWNKLDVIGFEWYIPLTTNLNPTISDLVSDARLIIDNKVKPLSEKFEGKPVLFSEYGWSAKPYAWTSTYTGGGEGNFSKYDAVLAYEAVYEAVKDEPIVLGMFDAWPLGNAENMNWIRDYNGPDLRFSIIEPEIAKWYSYFK
ncbi:Uncharacterised protein [Candidatus Tiddalikarchaeum anstoanum]|nr:Uncharacterised protein [Candidatus Tiddalikarchaeum anstoanum]